MTRLLVCHLELINQAFQSCCFFDGVQVLTLDILNQCHGYSDLVRNVANQRWYFLHPGQLRSSPAAFTGDQLVLVNPRCANHHGLDDTLLTYGLRQFFEFCHIKHRTWLVWSRRDELQR